MICTENCQVNLAHKLKTKSVLNGTEKNKIKKIKKQTVMGKIRGLR